MDVPKNYKKDTKTYVIADTHWQHSKIQEYCNRPVDFDQVIINQWKNTVHPQDIVFHLGDVIFGIRQQLKEIMAELPGTKILIRGNHDRNHSNNWFVQAGFAAVLEKAQISGIIFSHFPTTLTQEEIKRGMINVHGHFHNNHHRTWEKELKRRIRKYHYLFSLEEVGYRPISLEKIRRQIDVISTIKRINDQL